MHASHLKMMAVKYCVSNKSLVSSSLVEELYGQVVSAIAEAKHRET
jgi:hypothetical protein